MAPAGIEYDGMAKDVTIPNAVTAIARALRQFIFCLPVVGQTMSESFLATAKCRSKIRCLLYSNFIEIGFETERSKATGAIGKVPAI
jgi:hypothetical protein